MPLPAVQRTLPHTLFTAAAQSILSRPIPLTLSQSVPSIPSVSYAGEARDVFSALSQRMPPLDMGNQDSDDEDALEGYDALANTHPLTKEPKFYIPGRRMMGNTNE
jgi:hypothetical protein